MKTQTHKRPQNPVERPSKPEKIEPEEDKLQRFTGVVSEPIVVKAKDKEIAEKLAREKLYNIHSQIRINVRRSDE